MHFTHHLSAALILLVALLAAGCGPDKGTARLEGHFENINQGEFYLYAEGSDFAGFDTVRIDDGSFSYERALTHDVPATLLYPNYTQTHIVLSPGHTVTIKGDAAHIGDAEVEGTDDNRLLTDFRQKYGREHGTNQRLAAARFIRENAASCAAVVVFRQYLMQQAQPADPALALQMLDVLRQAQRHSPAVQALEVWARPLLTAAKGQRVKPFSALTLKGDSLHSHQWRGKRTAVVCIASWSSPSLEMARTAVEAARRSGSKWRVILVSVDADAEVCRRSLRRDTLDVPVVCDGRMFRSPAAEALALRYVPSALLLTADGRIEARDVTDKAELQRLMTR